MTCRGLQFPVLGMFIGYSVISGGSGQIMSAVITLVLLVYVSLMQGDKIVLLVCTVNVANQCVLQHS